MAAAVMRAMSFGTLSSSSSEDREGGRSSSRGSSTSGTRNRFSKSLSRESTIEPIDDNSTTGTSLGLSKSLSRLSVSSGVMPPGGGILINSGRSRPSSPQPPYSRSVELEDPPSHFDSSMSHSVSPPPPLSTTTSTRRPSHPDRTPSYASNSSITEPVTPTSPTFSTSAAAEHNQHRPEFNTSHSAGETTNSNNGRKPQIRFAPLPQIRPRSYSTGRNVWLEYDEDGFEVGQFAGPEGDAGDELESGMMIDGEGSVKAGGGSGGNGLGGRHLVRREEAGYGFDPNGDDDDDDDDQDVEDGGGDKWNTRRQSWTDSLVGIGGGVWGSSSSSSNKRREIDEDAVSVGSSGGTSDYGLSSSVGKDSGGYSKILKPFRFGRKKSTSSKGGRTSRVDGSANDDPSSLSRQSSVDSQYSRRSIDATNGSTAAANAPTKPKGSTGIPMRKASTWDSTNSAGSGTRTPKARLSTSTSTATMQNGRPTTPASSSVPNRDPASSPQIIYYASPSRSQRPARRAQYPPVAQRSRTAPKSINTVTKVEEPEFSEWGSVGSVGSVSSKGTSFGGGGGGSGKSAADEDEDGSGMAWIRKRRREREEKEKRDRELAAAAAASEAESKSAEVEESNETVADVSSGRTRERTVVPPKRTSTIDSTFSINSTASTVRPSSPRAKSGLSLTKPVEQPVAVAESEPTREEALTEEPVEEDRGIEGETEATVVDVEAEEEDEEEDEEDEEEEEEGGEEDKDDDDDLDEEELAQEEALADAARRTAKGAGAERYHSATHENKVTVVDNLKRQNSQTMQRKNSNGSQFA